VIRTYIRKKKDYKQSRGILIMKKLTITIALMLVVALAMPAFGASFSDVPSDHWAYDAINKLVAAGIVEGYPDGEFKGEQSMTRYEMAVMVSRALDNIVDEMEAMGEGLTTGQAEDVTAIVKSLMEKNTSEQLSDAQAEEVADIVDALTFELRSELKVLGAEVDALGKDVDELEATVAEMDVPQDNIEFTMDVTTQAEIASYGDNDNEKAAAIALLEDGDAVDETYATDPDEFVSESAFFQEYDMNIAGNLGEAEFNLAIDTIANVFMEEEPALDLASETDSNEFTMDTALLEVAYDVHNFRIGDLDDYHVTDYFIEDEDVEGIEMTSEFMGNDVKAFAVGSANYDADSPYDSDSIVDNYGDKDDEKFFGVELARDMDFGRVTGKVYHTRDFDVDEVPTNKNDNEVNIIAAQIEDVMFTDEFTMGAEVAFSDWEETATTGITAASDSGTFVRVNGEFTAIEDLTINGKVEIVDENFRGPYQDLEDPYDYDLFELGAEYVVNENNTVNGSVTMVQVGDLRKSEIETGTTDVEDDQMTVDLGWENVYGKFTNNVGVQYVQGEDNIKDYEETEVNLGTKYDWSETLAVGADVTYNMETKAAGDLKDYIYLTAFADKELADNVSWNNEVFYITGTVDETGVTVNGVPVTAGTDGDAMGMTSALTVSF
jgi:polyhydroxyalkanoate synthesis regulator phasin